MKPLTIYKASAGSGKTFTLAVEYIKLLIDNPLSFKNILAVTFTNKATEEMKLRILSQLYGIWKTLPDSNTYMRAVCDSLGISESHASQRAGMALSLLIHNYHYFRIETIDSFFQSVLRNLARELELNSNLKIGLNDTQIEEQAVDSLIESLTSTSIILQWLISYIFSNINENKGWNVIGQIKKFGKTIFRDFYKAVSDELDTTISRQNFFDEYTKQLKAIRVAAKKHMAGYAHDFEKITEEAGLHPTSYAKKANGICSYFNKLKGDDFSDKKCKTQIMEKCLSDAESWASKSSPDRKLIVSLAERSLMPLLQKAEEDRPKQWKLFATADFTLKHLDKLRLLSSIEAKVRELNGEANRFLLSDTQHLLRTLIKDSDSPFVFEKVGCRLEHIMIDEFQDTSTVQWDNFKVLLKDCMSHSKDGSTLINNLIVGDVKQSIYRWRAGDWRLLNGISSQFSLPEKNLEIKTLQKNYRSRHNVVEFNNCFFKTAAETEYDQEIQTSGEESANEIRSAYADVCQSSCGSNGGFVKIIMLPNEDYEHSMLDHTGKSVQDLLSHSVKESDIAILLRYNRHIPLVADYLGKTFPQLNIVSDEAFRLDASTAVNMIMQALTLLSNPDDVLSKACLAVNYQKNVLGSRRGHGEMLTAASENPEFLNTLLPAKFLMNMKSLNKKPLFETIDYIYSTFEIERLDNQSAYICVFYDKVADFSANNPGNINKFIEAWNDDLHSTTIQSDTATGLRLISIHKSKGLEFAHVIIPFCDWALESRDTTLWCNPTCPPFNDLPIVPVDYSKKLLETIYAEDYKNEHVQNRVDNLNLLYVAFTRAGQSLTVIGRNGKTKNGQPNRSELLKQCLPIVAKKLDGVCFEENTEESDKPSVFEYGSLSEILGKSTNDDRKHTKNVFLKPLKQHEIHMYPPQYDAHFRQSNKSRDFISGGNDHRKQYIEAGNIMHKLFSTIHTVNDIPTALRQMEFDGIIYDENLTVDKMRALLAERLSDKRVADWFAPRWRVFNECSILEHDHATGKTTERRPDRVITDGNETTVIDFKFGTERNSHKTQIKEYMRLLQDMGHANIRGFLWYVMENKIVEVKQTENDNI